MELYDAIKKRRSVRSFDGEPVSREQLDRLISAASLAPSSHNVQPWHFHVTTCDTRDRVAEIVALSTVHLQEYLETLSTDQLEHAEKFFAGLGGAPVVIAVSVPESDDELSRINAYLATGCAIQNLLLASVEEGLACCNVTFAFWVREKLAELLGIGSDREIVSLVLVGHPAETPVDTPRRGNVATFLG
jgi:nitroreductase